MSLYKYISPGHWEKILKNGLIRFSQPRALNDPFEMRPHFESFVEESGIKAMLKECEAQFINDAIKEFRAQLSPEQSGQLTPEILEQALTENPQKIQELVGDTFDQLMMITKEVTPGIKATFHDLMDQFVGTLCLAEKPDNRLMWAHYAQNHQGLVIEFDEKHQWFHLCKSEVDELSSIKKVKYSSNRPLHKCIGDLDGDTMFFQKGSEWEYEQEWRMLRPLKEADSIIENEAGNIHLFRFPADCVSGVVFGCRMSEKTKQDITDFLSRDDRYSQVKVYQASLDEAKYDLEISLVTALKA